MALAATVSGSILFPHARRPSRSYRPSSTRFGAVWYGIDTGSRNSVFAGYLLGAALMIAAAIVAWRYAVAAERKSLEQIARPLAFME